MKLVTREISLKILVILGLLGIMYTQDVHGQATGLEFEIYQIHNGTNTDLPAGYITYRAYVILTNPEDVLGTVFATPGETPPFSITTDCDFYQDPLGGFLGQDHSCALYPFFPTVEYDSYFTIGRASACDPGQNVTWVYIDPATGDASFEAGGNLSVFDGAFFVVNDGSINSIAGPDLRVLVGQFTTCGELCLSLNIQSFPLGVPGTAEFLVAAEGCISSPCAPGLFEVEATETTDVTCFGVGDGSFTAELIAPGTGDVVWDLFNENDPGNPVVNGNTDGNFSGLEAGSYFVVVEDTNGCLDTTETLTIIEPSELTLDATILQEILCAGNTNGEIDIDIQGGTPPYVFSVNEAVTPNQDILTGLSCGDYTLNVLDDSDCSVDVLISLDCPDELLIDLPTTNISCFESCDGSIVGSISGGTGDLTVALNGPDGFSENFLGNPIDIDYTALCAGTYELSVSDENNCIEELELEITQPDQLTVTELHADVSCFGLCDGSINLTIEGGTLPYDINYDGADPLATCAGIYSIQVCDANNCCVDIEIEITEPTELEVSIEVVDVVCPEESTGSITATATGSLPDYEYSITGPVNVGPQAGNVFNGIPGGIYELVVSDQGNCTFSQEVIVLTPDPFVLGLTGTDINCFEACDGSITGTISGGTGILTGTVIGPDGFTSDLIGQDINVNLQDLCAGDYTISIVDENECEASLDISLTQPDEFIVTEEHTDISCFGLCDGTIVLNISGGTEPYTTDFGGNDPNALCAGTYTVNVCDDNNCCVELVIEIIQPTQIVATIELTDVTCPGDDNGALVVNTVGGVPDYSFELNGPIEVGPQAESSFENLPGGNYTLIVTDDTNCSISEEISIFAPDALSIELIASDVSCNGFGDGSIEVSTDGGTGEFSYTANGEVGGPIFSELVPDDYIIIATDESGCEIEATESIAEPEELIAELVFVQAVGCGGDCDGIAEVEVSGGIPEYSTIWNGDPFQNNDELCAGLNSFAITDQNNCLTVLELEIDEPDPLEIIINADPVTCTGMTDGSAAVAVTGGTGEVSLDLGELSPEDLLQLPEGEYIVSATDITGCSTQDTIFINAEIITNLNLEIFTSPVSCWNEGDGTATAAVTGGNEPITVTWDDPLEQVGPIAVGLGEGLYTVTITDVIGCTIDSVALIEPSVGCFFIANVLTPNGDGANDTWLIGGLEYFPDSKVQVYNRWGQLLFESTGYNSPWNGTYGGQLLPTADYYYVIEYDSDKEPLTGAVTIKY